MPDRYEIRVRHRVGPELVHVLGDLEPELSDDCTILLTERADQPALHGALARLADFGLEVLSVERIETSE